VTLNFFTGGFTWFQQWNRWVTACGLVNTGTRSGTGQQINKATTEYPRNWWCWQCLIVEEEHQPSNSNFICQIIMNPFYSSMYFDRLICLAKIRLWPWGFIYSLANPNVLSSQLSITFTAVQASQFQHSCMPSRMLNLSYPSHISVNIETHHTLQFFRYKKDLKNKKSFLTFCVILVFEQPS